MTVEFRATVFHADVFANSLMLTLHVGFQAYAYIKRASGLEKQSEFPYFSGANGRTGWCLGRDAKAKTADITGFSYVRAPTTAGRKTPLATKNLLEDTSKGGDAIHQ